MELWVLEYINNIVCVYASAIYLALYLDRWMGVRVGRSGGKHVYLDIFPLF